MAAKLDLATFGGLIIGIGGIVGGLILEGGSIGQIVAPTALLIVLGGTLGAVLVATPLAALRAGMRSLAGVFFEKTQDPESMIEKLVEYSTKARKNGIVSLELVADKAPDPFLRKALNLAVDGTDLQELRSMMELEITVEEHRGEAEAAIEITCGDFAFSGESKVEPCRDSRPPNALFSFNGSTAAPIDTQLLNGGVCVS